MSPDWEALLISEGFHSIIHRGQALLGLAQSSLPALRVWCRGSDVGFNDCEKSLKQIGCLEKHFTCFSILNTGFFSHDHREIKCKFKTFSNQAIKIVVFLLCQISWSHLGMTTAYTQSNCRQTLLPLLHQNLNRGSHTDERGAPRTEVHSTRSGRAGTLSCFLDVPCPGTETSANRVWVLSGSFIYSFISEVDAWHTVDLPGRTWVTSRILPSDLH